MSRREAAPEPVRESFDDRHRYKTRDQKIETCIAYERYGVNNEDGKPCLERVKFAFGIDDRDIVEYLKNKNEVELSRKT